MCQALAAAPDLIGEIDKKVSNGSPPPVTNAVKDIGAGAGQKDPAGQGEGTF